jgi:hypothetical protein
MAAPSFEILTKITRDELRKAVRDSYKIKKEIYNSNNVQND